MKDNAIILDFCRWSNPLEVMAAENVYVEQRSTALALLSRFQKTTARQCIRVFALCCLSSHSFYLAAKISALPPLPLPLARHSNDDQAFQAALAWASAGQALTRIDADGNAEPFHFYVDASGAALRWRSLTAGQVIAHFIIAS